MIPTLPAGFDSPSNGCEHSLDLFLTSHIFSKGFIVPEGLSDPPPPRLDAPYDVWDDALSAASGIQLCVADGSVGAEHWRQNLSKVGFGAFLSFPT
jgi:hypothetical protein